MPIKHCEKCHSQIRDDGSHYQMTFCVQEELKALRAQVAELTEQREGWQLVPILPTDRMRHAFHKAFERYEDGVGDMPDSGWKFMLNAASKPPALQGTKETEL